MERPRSATHRRVSSAWKGKPRDELLRQQVRQMLRHGKFKASGRSKPAQEYLLRCATEENCLPNINAPVDILNTVSLASGLPISLLSIKKCSDQLLVRRGRVGEAYVFNTVGHEIDVQDLVVVCDTSSNQDRPVGSPIKDSMAGKIESSDDHLVAIIYAPTAAFRESNSLLQNACQALADAFKKYIPGVEATILQS